MNRRERTRVIRFYSRRLPWVHFLLPVAAGLVLAAIVAGLGLFFCLVALAMLLPIIPARWPVAEYIVASLVAVVTVAIPAALAMRMIISAGTGDVIRRRIRSRRCPGCEFNLRGLRAHGESVVCPECGVHLPLDLYVRSPAAANTTALFSNEATANHPRTNSPSATS